MICNVLFVWCIEPSRIYEKGSRGKICVSDWCAIMKRGAMETMICVSYHLKHEEIVPVVQRRKMNI